MGAFECDSIGNNKISLAQIGIFFQKTLNIKEIHNSEKSDSIRYNLIEEYNQLKIKSRNKEFFYYSSECKIISDFIPFEQEKEIFIKWVKILYDINNIKEFNITQTRKIDSDEFFKKNLEKAFLNNKKYFLKLVTKGVPLNLRQFIWTIIIDKDEQDILNVSNIEKEKIYFETLLSLNKVTKDIEQIEKDVNRTFIGEENTKENITILKKILIALNNLNEKIGYCQGINFIIALILKITKFNMIKTFHLARLILRRIKGYFTKDFPLLKYNLKKFDKGFKQLFPKLFDHFKNNDIVNEIYVGKWIQTLFTVNLNFDNACHIWDALLVYGMDFIIPISLSILYFIKDNLLNLNDSTDIVKLLQNTLHTEDENLIQSIYREDINLRKYVIQVRDIISNAKKIRNQLNLGPHDGNEYSQRNKIDIRESLILRNSTTSNGSCNFEKKMEQIKTQKLNEKDFIISQEDKSTNTKMIDKIRVNKFYTTYHKKYIKDRTMININNKNRIINNNKINKRERHFSFEFNDNIIKNNLFNKNNFEYNSNVENYNYANKKQKINNINNNIYRTYTDNQNSKNVYIRNNKFINNKLASIYSPNNIFSFQNINQLCNNFLYEHNPKNINNQYNLINNNIRNNIGSNQNIFNNELNYNNNNPIINININYNPIYYNIINNINSNQNILRKNIKTPEVNRIKLREKIYNKMNKKRNNNLDIDYFSNGINEFSQGEKYKNEIRNFNNIKIIM